MALYEKRFRDLMDLKIFVMTDDDIRLSRRIQRDIAERGRTVEDVLAQYNRFVKTSYDEFIKPTMKYADIIIPHGRSNTVAIDFVVSNLKTRVPVEDLIEDFSKKPPLEPEIEAPNFGVVEITDEGDRKRVDVLIKKIGQTIDEISEENTILREFFVDSLLHKLFSLKTFDREHPQRRFNTETQIFIPEILGDLGEASAVDFVQHGPAGKDLEIFCIISKWSRVTRVIKSSGNRKLTIYRLASIKDIEDDEEELRLKYIADSLKIINQGHFTSVYDKYA
jgi:hypothetical protein